MNCPDLLALQITHTHNITEIFHQSDPAPVRGKAPGCGVFALRLDFRQFFQSAPSRINARENFLFARCFGKKRKFGTLKMRIARGVDRSASAQFQRCRQKLECGAIAACSGRSDWPSPSSTCRRGLPSLLNSSRYHPRITPLIPTICCACRC